MKQKFIFMAALCAVAFHVNAQTNRGNFLLGGSFGYKSTKDGGPKPALNQYNFSPRIGYFITNNFAAGVRLSYAHFQQKGWISIDDNQSPETNYGFRRNDIGFGLFTRYYINIVNRFKFFADLDANYNRLSGKQIDEKGNEHSPADKQREYTVNIRPGFAFIPTKRWSFELAFPLLTYYNVVNDPHLKRENDVTSVSAIVIGLKTFTPAIGVNYHF